MQSSPMGLLMEESRIVLRIKLLLHHKLVILVASEYKLNKILPDVKHNAPDDINTDII